MVERLCLMSKVICAYVAQPNTEKTDAMATVPHVVEYEEDGVKYTTTINAECPVCAMEKVRNRLQWRRLASNRKYS